MKRDNHNKKNLRVALYCRVATDSDDGKSLEQQKKYLHSVADEKGYSVISEISDVASGLSIERLGIRKLEELARDKEIDAVIASDHARISRSFQDYQRLQSNLGKKNVEIVIPGKPSGRMSSKK